jgi:hypothetical protein
MNGSNDCRLFWLVEHQPFTIPSYLGKVRPDAQRIRIVAQTWVGQHHGR